MGAEQVDPLAVRSRAALVAAMTALLDERDLDGISITQVVQAAGVTRPTFYQHYGDIAHLASDAAVGRLDAEFDHRESGPLSVEGWLTGVEPMVTRLLAHLAEHRDFYRRVLYGLGTRAATDAAVDLVARRILERSPLGALAGQPGAPDPEETQDSVVIISGGIVWLITSWLSTELTGRDTVKAMAHRVSVQLVRLALAAGAAPPAPRVEQAG